MNVNDFILLSLILLLMFTIVFLLFKLRKVIKFEQGKKYVYNYYNSGMVLEDIKIKVEKVHNYKGIGDISEDDWHHYLGCRSAIREIENIK